jgi:hypothetical protein
MTPSPGGYRFTQFALWAPPTSDSPRRQKLWRREKCHTDSEAEVWVPDNFAG